VLPCVALLALDHHLAVGIIGCAANAADDVVRLALSVPLGFGIGFILCRGISLGGRLALLRRCRRGCLDLAVGEAAVDALG